MLTKKSQFIVYLAGPIAGCFDIECHAWREAFKELFDGETLDPTRRDYRGLDACNLDVATEIVHNDKADIDASDAIVVYHDRPSVGTSMEVLYAYDRKIPVVLINKVGPSISPWMVYHSTVLVGTLQEAVDMFARPSLFAHKRVKSKPQQYEVVTTS